MSEAAFSFGPLGAMTDLVVAPAVQVENGRELKTTVTSRGVRWSVSDGLCKPFWEGQS